MQTTMIPVNPNAQEEVRSVLNYLKSIAGRQVVLGQHTQTMGQEELVYIYRVTGELPALCGFELLAYSPNISPQSDEECLSEVRAAAGTLKRAWYWAKKGGLITFTWHWFSPLGGCHKSFYSEFTDYDADRAVTPGTPEYAALLSDMDYMAGLLKPFCNAHVPILWRPFHECDGEFFWWGKKGPGAVKKLYRLMYERYTEHFHLDNLIWVFNAAAPACYPGDDVVDIISRDMYPEAHTHTGCARELAELKMLTPEPKLCAIGEIGPLPDVDAMIKEGLEWTYYMTWSHDFGMSERFTKKEILRRNYLSDRGVTLSKLPGLYHVSEDEFAVTAGKKV